MFTNFGIKGVGCWCPLYHPRNLRFPLNTLRKPVV